MHPYIYYEFEKLCSNLDVRGKVLEIGASPHHPTLLTLPSLKHASLRVGVGLDGSVDTDDYTILHQDAHDLSIFQDQSFELVLSNSMLEHDPQFWITLKEAHRVLAKDGWMIVGVPGFAKSAGIPLTKNILEAISSDPIGKNILNILRGSAITLGVHNYPGDFYRFSPQAMKEVILKDLTDIKVLTVMLPPRVIGSGRKAIVDSHAAL